MALSLSQRLHSFHLSPLRWASVPVKIAHRSPHSPPSIPPSSESAQKLGSSQNHAFTSISASAFTSASASAFTSASASPSPPLTITGAVSSVLVDDGLKKGFSETDPKPRIVFRFNASRRKEAAAPAAGRAVSGGWRTQETPSAKAIQCGPSEPPSILETFKARATNTRQSTQIFSMRLTQKEINDDFQEVKGMKPQRKRTRGGKQANADALFPGVVLRPIPIAKKRKY